MFIKRLFLASLICILFSSCILTKDKIPPVQDPARSLYGLVIMRDLRGMEKEAKFEAAFSHNSIRTVRGGGEASADDHSSAITLPRWVDAFRGEPTENCVVFESPVGGSSDGSFDVADRESAFVSVGKLQFGAAFQGNLITIPEKQDHIYRGWLPTDFSAEARQIQYKGAGDVLPFGLAFTVPKALDLASANGELFSEQSQVVIKHREPIELRWQRPHIVNAISRVALSVVVKKETTQSELYCEEWEDQLEEGTGTEILWKITPETFEDLPPGTQDVTIKLLRGHITQYKQGHRNIQFVSSRVWTSQAIVEF